LKNNINYKLGIPYISLENLDKKLHNDGIIVYVNNKEQSVEEYKLFLKGDKNVKYSVDYGKARVITKEDYEKVVEKILEEFISTYSKSNKLADLPPEEEITLISDYV